MAHIMTKRGNLDNIVTYQHICDTTADLSNISQEYRTLGSIAIVIEGEGGGLEIYITNSNKQWIPLTVSSSTGGGEGVTLTEVNELITDALGNITGFSTQIVNALPVSNINTGTIYLIANNNGNNNGYDEYIYVNNNWQKIGSTANIQQLYNIQDGHGQGSIEEGNLNSPGGVSATGQYSHAEGNGTIASAPNSHAEGAGTTASSYNSHSEGGTTTASGGNSHAEGVETIASGSSSHAEGCLTIASGGNSHAENAGATASGDNSHAEGMFTIANHKSQHVFGEYNIADDNISASNTRGTYVEIVGNGTSNVLRSNIRTLDWDGNEQLAGDLTLAGNINKGRKANTTIGLGSFAFGVEVTASGAYSHAESSSTTASGACSHAEGGGTMASGVCSHAEGATAVASGDYSHAEGKSTIANHESQHVFGQYNIADPSVSSSDERGAYIEIVGNGTVNQQSNARTLDWNGNETLKGTLTTSSNGITIGNTTLTESQLQALLSLLQ